jgi:hypothetical protein
MTAAQTALPITQANAAGIYFVARRKQSAIGESIYVSVDPITGAVSAMENKLYPSGNVQTTDGGANPGGQVRLQSGYLQKVCKSSWSVALPVDQSITHREDDLPANHCNGQFRADGKYQPARVHRPIK